jgi:uncharacterized protein YegJ (DUF2314 family)
MRILAFVPMMIIALSACSGDSTDDKVTLVGENDAEMNGAIAEARRTLPGFWLSFEAPAADEAEFYVKVPLRDSGNTEYFWIGQLQRKSGKVTGVLSNYPQLVSHVRFGQSVTIAEESISDWKFMKGARLKGGYTIAVLLKRLPESEAASLKQKFGW